MQLKSKLFASAVAFSMVLSMVAVPASAQTTAELTAQINALLAQIAQLQAQISGGTSGAATTFTKDLTVGSSGAEVTALQQFLVGKGFLTMPAGVAYGYFGSLTKSALAAYQASAGISPAAGYFGPITRAKVNAAGGTTTGGTTTGGTTTGITTPGAEGTISVTESSSGIASTVYEGDTMAPILGIKVEAKNSDMSVQRFKFDLDEDVTGSDTKFYNKIYKKLYVTEGGNVLASVDLNSSTVAKDGSDYFITIAGFNSIVSKGSSKTYVIKADAYPAIDSSDFNTETYTIALASNGVRAVDGAGIDQYGGTTSVANTPTIAASLVDSAALKVSTNTSTPKKTDVICTSGSDEDECDKLTVLTMDVKAEKDEVTITDLRVEIDESTAGTATTPTLYIFDGSTELDNASVTTSGDNYATFSDLDYVVPKDTTKTLTIKVDVKDNDGTRTGYTAAASSSDFTTENSQGDSATVSGTATGNEIGTLEIGPEIALVSKSITTDGVAQTNGSPVSTSTLTATFNIKIKAVGGAIEFGTVASGTPTFSSSTASFKLYRNGSYDSTLASAATSTAYTTPSGVTTTGIGTNSWSLAENSEVTIPVTFQVVGRTATGGALSSGLYSVSFQGVKYVEPSAGTAAKTMNFMADETDWITAAVSFP